MCVLLICQRAATNKYYSSPLEAAPLSACPSICLSVSVCRIGLPFGLIDDIALPSPPPLFVLGKPHTDSQLPGKPHIAPTRKSRQIRQVYAWVPHPSSLDVSMQETSHSPRSKVVLPCRVPLHPGSQPGRKPRRPRRKSPGLGALLGRRKETRRGVRGG